MTDVNHKQTLTLRNGRSEPMVVRVEPWADEEVLHPNESLELAFEGPTGHAIEIEAEPGALVVYGWGDSIVEIRR
jgi:hypothetical protein